MRDVISVFDYLLLREDATSVRVLDLHSSAYQDYKDTLKNAELHILIKLAFSVHVEHPYGFLLNILNALNLSENKEIAQMAWNYLNDGYDDRLVFILL